MCIFSIYLLYCLRILEVGKMSLFLKKLPTPVGCVALGLIGLGTLLGSYNVLFLYCFGGISILLQAAVLLKLMIPGERKSIYADSTALSCLAGTSMAMMLTAAQLKKLFLMSNARIIWVFAVIFHLYILILFSRKILRERPGLAAVRGSWLLVYVGLAAAAISAPVFSANRVGLLLLVPAAMGALILLPLVYRADLRSDSVPVGQKPLFCISAAPVSIWLAGYLSAASTPSPLLVLSLMVAAQLLYLPALLRCIHTLGQPFSPAFAAYTFPFVISASALKQASPFSSLSAQVNVLLTLESLIALLLCIYTFCLYLRFLCKPKAS